MRYVVYGAGAVGGAIGGLLASAGQEVALIARGAHLEAMRSHGLRLITPAAELHPPVTVAGSVAEAAPQSGDVVILAMKGQDTEAAVRELDALGGREVAIVCAQNGVENERVVARRGFATYGMCVVIIAAHLEAGRVSLHLAPTGGILDLGCYPEGADATSTAIASDLRTAGFDSVAQPHIMRWKYSKLLGNIGNAIDAACGRSARSSELLARARAEAVACYTAAGIDYASEEEVRQRQVNLPEPQPAGGVETPGGSSWQSLARNAGGIESDWLNGEIVLLGRRCGVATPVNDVFRQLGNRLIREHVTPGSLPLELVDAQVDEYEHRPPAVRR